MLLLLLTLKEMLLLLMLAEMLLTIYTALLLCVQAAGQTGEAAPGEHEGAAVPGRGAQQL